MSVKKALISVSQCLQDSQPLCKVPVSSSIPTVSSFDRSSSDPNAELFPRLNSLLTSMEGLSIYERTTNSNESSNRDSKGGEHEVVFRLLCSNNVAGSVIGKRGAIVRALESKTGASIIFAAPLSEHAERIVTISAIEVSHMRMFPMPQLTQAYRIFSVFCVLFHVHMFMQQRIVMHLVDLFENTFWNFIIFIVDLTLPFFFFTSRALNLVILLHKMLLFLSLLELLKITLERVFSKSLAWNHL